MEEPPDNNNNSKTTDFVGSTSAVAKQASQPKPRDVQSQFMTEGMIRLRRQFDYNSRPRKNAIAIVHPETKEVLFPGITKIVPKDDESNKEGDDQPGEKDKQEQPAQYQWEQFPQFNNIQEIWSEPQAVFQNHVVMDPNFDPFHPFYANYHYPVTYYDLPTFNIGPHP